MCKGEGQKEGWTPERGDRERWLHRTGQVKAFQDPGGLRGPAKWRLLPWETRPTIKGEGGPQSQDWNQLDGRKPQQKILGNQTRAWS